MRVPEQSPESAMTPDEPAHQDEPDRNILKLRDEILEEDGPPDIIFGPDLFDTRINGHAPFTEGYLRAIAKGLITFNGETVTEPDLETTAAEVFPDASEEELPALMFEYGMQIEPAELDEQ